MALTVEEFRALGLALYGYGWQSALARALGVNSRTVQRWSGAETPLPDWLEGKIRQLMGGEDQPIRLDRPRDEWIVGEGPPDRNGNRREYVSHERWPRFTARAVMIEDGVPSAHELPVDLDGVTYQAGPDTMLCEIFWLDRPPGPAELTRLMEAASDALEDCSGSTE